MKRRAVLWSPLLLGARRVWKSLAASLAPDRAAIGEVQPRAIDDENRIILENSNHRLSFDRKNARLLSFRAKSAADQEFIVSTDTVPVFIIQYLTKDKGFRQFASTDAKDVIVQPAGNTMTAVFSGLGELDLSATM